jgi:LacI family transcriptional regulator
MAVTIKDVAKKVGVTPATVSMVINNKSRISLATRNKVLRAIEELGYYPHEGARNLVLKRSNTIGVAAPSFISTSALEILAGIEAEVRQSGHNMVLISTHGMEQIEDSVVARVARERKVDGLIALNLQFTQSQQSSFREQKLVLVAIESEMSGWDSLGPDHREGAYAATKHLLSLGHRRLAFLNAPPSLSFAKQREEGFRKAMLEAGLEPARQRMLVVPDASKESGLEAAKILLAQDTRPTAVFAAAGDLCAAGVISAAQAAGLKVPEDLSVIGYGDHPVAALLEPALSTLREPLAQIGARAFGMIKAALAEGGGHRAVRETQLPVLVERQSCAFMGSKPGFNGQMKDSGR